MRLTQHSRDGLPIQTSRRGVYTFATIVARAIAEC
jgi:hypothetical protein